VSIPAAGKHAPGLQDAQVTADHRLGQIDLFRQFADRKFLVQQDGDQTQTVSVGESAQTVADPLQIDARERVTRSLLPALGSAVA